MHIRFPTAVALLLLAISAAWADGPVPPPPPLSAADCSAGQAVTGYPSPGSPIGAGGHCGIPVASGTINVSTIGQIGAYTGTGTITGFTPGGDVTFTSPNFTITKINGATLGSATATSGNVLVGSGTQWVTHAISGDATLVASGALTISAGAITSGKLAAGASSGNLGYTPLSPANNLSDLNNAAAARTNLGLGSIATHATTEYFAIANSLGEGNANIPAIRTNLALGSAATQNTGTSGGTIGLNNANNILSGALTFSGSISGTALTTYLASPAPLGTTTPAAGKFTTLQATGNLTTNVTGSTQCLHVDTTGLVTGSGADCGTGSGGGSGNMTGSGSTTAGNLLVSNNTGGTLTTAADAGLAPGAIARVSGSTLTSTTLTSPAINSATLAGTFSGTPSYSGVPTYSGLSAGTVVAGKYLGLDSGNNLVLSSDVDTLSGAQTVAGAKTFSSTLNVTGTFQIGGATVALPVTVANGGTGLATQTSNAIYKGNGTSPPAVSALSDNGTIILTTESIDLVANAALFEVANAGSTGTTVNHLAKLTGAPSTAVITAISDVDGALGIVTGGSGTTGSAQIAVTGIALCAFDGATTAGNYVTISSSVAGDCHAAGSSRPTAAQVVGRVLATLGSAGNANVALADGFANSSGSGGISGLTTGQLGIAGSATTITSSVPFGTTGNNTVVETNGSGFIANSLISALPNANLANSTVSFAGHSVALGGANQAIAIGDLSNIANSTIVGNNSGGSGPPLALTAAQVSTLMGLGTMSTQAASAVSISGGTITGTAVTGLATPTGTTDAATKAYVDASLTGSNLHPQVAVATAAVLPNSPTAGGSGVGKTLTSGANAVFVTDGYTPVLNDRVLVKDQATGADNGIYKLTQLGVNGTTPWILTRATDFDQAVTGEVALGAYVFVANGIANANSQWQLGAPTPSSITVDTTALTFNKLSVSPVFTADGTTIQLSGSQFSALPNGILSAITATPNSLLARGASTWAGVAPVNNAVLVTSGAGVPSESTTLPAGLTIPGYLTANQTITLSGDTTGSGTTAITTTTGKVNGVTYPAAPSTNTVPVVTGANTITYQQIPTAAHADSSVTYAKIQNVTTARLLGNNTGSAAAPVEIPFGQTGNSTVVATDSGGHISNTLITALPNSSLANASVTIGSTNVALGATAATVAGLTLTAPTISTITNTGTLTLPTATGTLLETAGTNTVTGTLNVSGTFQIGGTTVALPVTVANGGTGLATQTANAIYKGNGTSPPAVSALSDNGTILSSTESLSLTTKAVITEVANAGTTGTTVNKLAKVTGAPSTAVIAGTSDTTGTVVGIVVGGAGTTGSAQIAFGGQASCIFDGATAAGDFVQVSTTVAGDCHDFGATYPSSGAVLGQVLSTNGAGGTYLMRVIPGGTVAGGGGSGTATTLSVPGSIFTATGTGTATIGFTVAGTSGGIPYFSSASAIGSSAALTLNLPVIGGGAGAAPTVGTRSGNTTEFATSTGAKTSTHGAAWDASGNLIDSGAVPLAMPSIATTHVLGNATGSTAAAADTPVVSGSVGLTVASSGGNLTFNLAAPTNDQSGGGYTIVTGDNGRTVMCGGGFSYPIAQAGTTGFGAGWGTQIHNTTSSGNCTLTTSAPAVFKGASNTTTLLLGPGDWTSLSSTGANYDTLVGHYSGGGAVVSLGSVTASNSAALTFTGLSAAYIEYELSCVDLIPAVTSSTAMVRVGEGAGPTWMTSGYFSAFYGGTYGSGWTPIGASLNSSGILISRAADVVKDTTRPVMFNLRLANPSSITATKKVTFQSDYNIPNLDGASLSGSGGFYGDTNADTAIEFLFLEGNTQSGTCSLRGKLQ